MLASNTAIIRIGTRLKDFACGLNGSRVNKAVCIRYYSFILVNCLPLKLRREWKFTDMKLSYSLSFEANLRFWYRVFICLLLLSAIIALLFEFTIYYKKTIVFPFLFGHTLVKHAVFQVNIDKTLWQLILNSFFFKYDA